MKQLFLLSYLSILAMFPAFGQIVKLEPANPTASDSVKIIFDATQGTAGLVGENSVYIHTGVVTDAPAGTAWQNVVGNWGQDDGVGKMTKVAGEANKWQITIKPSIRAYYNVPQTTQIFRLSMVFRNANGSKEGKGSPGNFTGGTVAANGDIYLNINPGNFVQITSPTAPRQFVTANTVIKFGAKSSFTATSIKLFLDQDNGSGFQEVAAATSADTVGFNYTVTGTKVIKAKVEAIGSAGIVSDEEEFNFVVQTPTVTEALPASLKQGINYDPNDPTKATLVLLAPLKQFVYVVGDMTNWQLLATHQMKRDPDNETYWLELTGLEAGKEYVYQYWVDGVITIGDPYADKVVDPWNDPFIPASLYPNPTPYNKTQFGPATVLQTNQTPYSWQFPKVAGTMPKAEELVVYELLVRDFIGSHSYQDLIDSLQYLKRLGVNAIQLMPIMEFEGNESWGYNPMYYFAPDKYYGTKNDLKEFIDKAHEMGIVVILDMVLNHAFGLNSMVRMYWDAANNRPAANSPWFNPVARHPFNVGFDFNHESQYTKDFMDDVNKYWLTEYNFDGYRFDLSKGFTQTNNPDNVGAWSSRDPSRIALLKRMADVIWAAKPEAYVILEHFADNSEEKELAEYGNGMMLWGNHTHDYGRLVEGDTTGNYQGVVASARGWAKKGVVAYMESHDEERLMVKALGGGKSEGTYDIKQLEVALDRVKLASAFFYTAPGPKMLWQFGELGYDFSINACPPDGTEIRDDCRVANKPIPWGEPLNLNYHLNAARQSLYKATAAINALVNRNNDVFEGGAFIWTTSGKMRRIELKHERMDVVIVGNFGLTTGTTSPKFTKAGKWYRYFEGDSLTVANTDTVISLAPGYFTIFTTVRQPAPEAGLVRPFSPIVTTDPAVIRAGESVKIIFDATVADPDGTAGLAGVDKVYMYAGVVLTSQTGTTLANIKGSTNQDDNVGVMTKVAGQTDKWEITINPRTYFGVPAGQNIYRIGLYFRNPDGSRRGKGAGGSNIFLPVLLEGPIVTTEPAAFTINDAVKILFDARVADRDGTAGLVGASKVYMHSGIITSGPTGTGWTNVIGNWGQDDGIGQMTKKAGESDIWERTVTPKTYYNVADGTTVYRLGIVFRDASGNNRGKAAGGQDIFIDVNQLTGLPIIDISNDLLLYPNPTQGQLNINLQNSLRGAIQTRVIDMSGRIHSVGLWQKSGENLSISLETNDLAPGLYLLQVIQGQRQAMKRFVVE